MRKFAAASVCITLAMIALAGLNLAAQADQSSAPPPPTPSQLLHGKKIFISNVPGTLTLGQHSAEEAPNYTYNQFYASMKSWGYYDLVSAPADADLIFEISLAERSTLGDMVHAANNLRLPYLELVVRDPRTQTILWWFAERLQGANRPATGQRNYNQAMTNLVNDLKKVVGQFTVVPASTKP